MRWGSAQHSQRGRGGFPSVLWSIPSTYGNEKYDRNLLSL